MKQVNKLAAVALAAITVLMLDACSKTDNGSDAATPAATATTTCTQNPAGAWVNPSGAACTPTTITCPANGQYVIYGQTYSCTPGQIVQSGTYPSPTNGYPYQSNPPQGSGCAGWTQEYQQQYVPIYLNGQLVCANYNDLIASMQQSSYYNSYYTSTPYYNYGPQYYYQYPPYSSGSSGGGCGTGIAFSYQGFGAAICF